MNNETKCVVLIQSDEAWGQIGLYREDICSIAIKSRSCMEGKSRQQFDVGISTFRFHQQLLRACRRPEEGASLRCRCQCHCAGYRNFFAHFIRPRFLLLYSSYTVVVNISSRRMVYMLAIDV